MGVDVDEPSVELSVSVSFFYCWVATPLGIRHTISEDGKSAQSAASYSLHVCLSSITNKIRTTLVETASETKHKFVEPV